MTKKRFPKPLRKYETDTYYYEQESVLKALGFPVGNRSRWYGTIRCDGINYVTVEVGRKVEPKEEASAPTQLLSEKKSWSKK